VKVELFHRGEPIDLDVDGSGETRTIRVGDRQAIASPIAIATSAGTLRLDGTPTRFLYERRGQKLTIALRGECFEFDLSSESRAKRGASAHGNPETRSPMPGKVLHVTAKPGLEVAAGEPLLILEAMKMENVLTAEIAGTVKEVHVKAGDMVEPGKLLVLLEPKPT
jgi:3-methylcrotonyl-CoA carboxylase alpha subunit